MKQLINKMTFVFFTALIGLVCGEMQGYFIQVTNNTGNVPLRMGINADTHLAGCNSTRWDTQGLPGRVLAPNGIPVTAINFSGVCSGACWSSNLTLYIGSKNTEVSIPLAASMTPGCADYYLYFYIDDRTPGSPTYNWLRIELQTGRNGDINRVVHSIRYLLPSQYL